MRTYETTIILSVKSEEAAREERIKKYTDFLTENGAVELTVDRRGTRRLAYLINDEDQGDYTFLRYVAPPTLPDELEREFRIDEEILRYLNLLLHVHPLNEDERLALMGKQPSRLSSDATTKTPSDSNGDDDHDNTKDNNGDSNDANDSNDGEDD